MAELVPGLIFDANLLVAALVAFTAGLVGFASPCVVPLVPGYLSYVTGFSGEQLESSDVAARGRTVLGALLFVIGFAIPFTMLGVAFGALDFLATNTIARIVLGGIVALFGLLMMSGRLVREMRATSTLPATGLAAAPFIGFAFGVGWTPCIGPALGAILTLAATTGGSARGGVLGFVFALGLGLPFVLFAAFFHKMARTLAFMRRNSRRMQIIGGGLLFTVGLAIVTGAWEQFIIWLRPFIVGFEPPI